MAVVSGGGVAVRTERHDRAEWCRQARGGAGEFLSVAADDIARTITEIKELPTRPEAPTRRMRGAGQERKMKETVDYPCSQFSIPCCLSDLPYPLPARLAVATRPTARRRTDNCGGASCRPSGACTAGWSGLPGTALRGVRPGVAERRSTRNRPRFAEGACWSNRPSFCEGQCEP